MSIASILLLLLLLCLPAIGIELVSLDDAIQCSLGGADQAARANAAAGASAAAPHERRTTTARARSRTTTAAAIRRGGCRRYGSTRAEYRVWYPSDTLTRLLRDIQDGDADETTATATTSSGSSTVEGEIDPTVEEMRVLIDGEYYFPKSCYTCKARFYKPHFFYDRVRATRTRARARASRRAGVVELTPMSWAWL